MMTAEETYNVLDRHFRDCVRFWERELKTDSDLDSRPYRNALKDIARIEFNPFIPFPTEADRLDVAEVERFKMSRLMDIAGVAR